jgi:hypothetical protein
VTSDIRRVTADIRFDASAVTALHVSESQSLAEVRMVLGRVVVTVMSVVVLVLMPGCGSSGPERVAVRGTVKLNGQPLHHGSVTFVPVGDVRGPATTATVIKGSFELARRDGPVRGRASVQFVAGVDPGFDVNDDLSYAAYQEQQKEQRKPVDLGFRSVTLESGQPAELVFDGDRTDLEFSLVTQGDGRRRQPGMRASSSARP